MCMVNFLCPWLTAHLIGGVKMSGCREMLTVLLIGCGQRRKLSLGNRIEKGCIFLEHQH
jgi:hypothetical protein